MTARQKHFLFPFFSLPFPFLFTVISRVVINGRRIRIRKRPTKTHETASHQHIATLTLRYGDIRPKQAVLACNCFLFPSLFPEPRVFFLA